MAGPIFHRTRSSTSLYKRSSRPLRRPLYIVVLILLGLLLWTIRARFNDQPRSNLVKEMRQLHERAKTSHQMLLSSQSQTLEAAVTEYKRRYSVDPPPGFDAWFRYATNLSSLIIDDYDDLVLDQLKPYRGFHIAKCDMTANKVASDDIVRICVIGSQIEVEGVDRDLVRSLVAMMQSVIDHLPEMCIVVNALDQPRTVLNRAMLSSLYGPRPPQTCEIQRFQDKRKLNVWGDVIMSCPHDTSARTGRGASTTTASSQLISDWHEAIDLCSFPAAPASGIILAPERLRLSNVVRPMLSSGALSTFHDIQYPAARHFEAGTETSEDSVDWEHKRPVMIWRGDSSGGWAHGNNWRQFQRQRLVAIASGKDHHLDSALYQRSDKPPSRNDVRRKPSVSHYMDVGFSNITFCDEEACEAMRKEFGVKSAMTHQQLTAGKLVLTMDGNGADATFYRLLKSSSAIMRQGLMREWHDNRLIPWLHYIPLSLGMQELPEMLDYLLNDGDDIAKTIADEGREWANKALRKEDMNVYIFRLLIEMGRRSY